MNLYVHALKTQFKFPSEQTAISEVQGEVQSNLFSSNIKQNALITCLKDQ